MIDFTTVCAVDERYLPLMRLSWQTWRKHRREIFQKPLLVMSAVPASDLDFVRKDHPNTRIVDIPPLASVSMRERVFTAFIQLAPWLVETKWFFKLDVDTVARWSDPHVSHWCASNLVAPPMRPEDSSVPQDNECDPAKQPVFVASPWNYTKPADAVVRLDAWADGVPELAKFPALNLPFDPKSDKVITRGRVASFTYFGRTDWHRWLAGLCRTLPVPSQDTLTWYVARRTGAFFRQHKMKRHGWSFCRHRTLATEVKQILEAA